MPIWRKNSPPSEIAQLTTPYMSTLELKSTLVSLISEHNTNIVLDLGCGIGAQSFFLAKNFPDVSFVGLDYNPNHIDVATVFSKKEEITNLSFEVFDIFNPDQSSTNKFKEKKIGLFSLHALCCFRNFEPFFDAIIQLNPSWFVVKSLFFHGPLEVLIHIRDFNNPQHDDDPNSDFNIFSKEKVTEYLKSNSFNVEYSDFYPEKSLPRPIDGKRMSYTMSTDFHPRTQFSGPVHLPWSFLKATRI